MPAATSPSTVAGGHARRFGAHARTDKWWAGPLATAVGLILFFGYLTVRAFQGTYYIAEGLPYLSPVAAPPLFGVGPEYMADYPGAVPAAQSLFGWAFPAWWPKFIPQSPAFFIPGLAIAFRATCYYYRKAYYRAFAASPPACGVEGQTILKYRGETALLLFQNLHRYTLYGALLLLGFLWYEGIAALFNNGRFGIGVGTVVMLLNAALLSGYTFGCHSWRHLIGGRKDCFSCVGDGRIGGAYKVWKKSSWLNARHLPFAWISLVWVAFTDVYIALVSMNVITDWNTW
jgi:hypothetical protein